jgi:GrpB-like predicted nucleotidyltransferase (UPF0157 family)
VGSDASRADELASILVHGLTPVWVEVVDYDQRWPAFYQQYSRRLQEVLGDLVVLIEHIGSTSVVGLVAKPVIDIVIGIEDPDDESAYVDTLLAEGYEVRVREPGHRCLRGGDLAMPVNLHVYRHDSPEIDRYLRFRDRLRASAEDRDLYATTKRHLAGRVWPDMNFYADAKTSVVEEILSRADRVD